jgi:Tfp pilus assembly protein PilX
MKERKHGKPKTGPLLHKTQDARRRTHDAKGQAMFFVLFILAVIGALSGTLALMWESEIRTRTSDRDGLIAFYLAQGGIEAAKIWARNNPGANQSCPATWTMLGRGRYCYAVAGATRNLSSIGQVLDGFGNVLAERRIAVQVNAGYTAQSPWSWREQ